jgi:hypothetical protein
MDDRQQLLDRRIAALEVENADLRRHLGQMEHELQRVLQRGKRTRGAGQPKDQTTAAAFTVPTCSDLTDTPCPHARANPASVDQVLHTCRKDSASVKTGEE